MTLKTVTVIHSLTFQLMFKSLNRDRENELFAKSLSIEHLLHDISCNNVILYCCCQINKQTKKLQSLLMLFQYTKGFSSHRSFALTQIEMRSEYIHQKANTSAHHTRPLFAMESFDLQDKSAVALLKHTHTHT